MLKLELGACSGQDPVAKTKMLKATTKDFNKWEGGRWERGGGRGEAENGRMGGRVGIYRVL
jgi:hypothetical protein